METQEQETPIETVQKKKTAVPYVIGIVLIVALAAAAFLGVRYFKQGDTGPSMPFADKKQLSFTGAGGETTNFELDIVPADELPETNPETMGIFVERKDNSIFIGTGDVRVMVSVEGSQSEPSIDSDFSGDKVEVVISNSTMVYKDVTQLDPEDPGAQVQQQVELSTIDDIAPQSSITVWGRKAGDRIIADVILFSQPMMFINNK